MKYIKRCWKCGVDYILNLTEEQLKELKQPNRRNVQEICPEIPAWKRELLISGMCGKCFGETMKCFGEGDE